MIMSACCFGRDNFINGDRTAVSDINGIARHIKLCRINKSYVININFPLGIERNRSCVLRCKILYKLKVRVAVARPVSLGVPTREMITPVAEHI